MAVSACCARGSVARRGVLVRRTGKRRRRRHFPSRRLRVGVRDLAAVRGKSGLRPVAECAFCGAGDKLLRAFGDKANYLSARFVVEAARCEDLRDLFAENHFAEGGSRSVVTLRYILRRVWRVVAVGGCKKAGRDRSNPVVVVSAHSIVLEGPMRSSLLLRHRLMATMLLLFCLANSATRVAARQQPKPLALDTTDLELVISGPREGVPDKGLLNFHPRKFKMTLINHSSRPVVVGPNAGEKNFSYDTTDWRATDPDGKPVPVRPSYRCSVSGARFFQPVRLTDESLSVLMPGESRDIGEIDISMWFKLDEPGEYKVYREFTFSPPRFSQIAMAGGTKFTGQFDVSAMSAEKRQLLLDAAGFTIKSNVWTLVIK